MKALILSLTFLMSTSAFAQLAAPVQAPAQAQAQIPPDCVFQVNPHSYACTKWTFDGNQMFPLFILDLNFLSGVWQPLTFADPVTENQNSEFIMLKNPQRPTVPEGVIDLATGRQLAPMIIQPNGFFLQNWHGLQLANQPGSFHVVDQFTFQFQFQDFNSLQTFNCRDFNRNGNHHLLCAWDTWSASQQAWQHRGFLGFLRH